MKSKQSLAVQRARRVDDLIARVECLIATLRSHDVQIGAITRERDRWQKHAEQLFTLYAGSDEHEAPIGPVLPRKRVRR